MTDIAATSKETLFTELASPPPGSTQAFLTFSAAGRYSIDGGSGSWQAGSSRDLLQTALKLALQEHGAAAVDALVKPLIARHEASASHPRRKMGDVVRLDGRSGFSVDAGLYRIVGRDDADPCFHCDVPNCQEWPTLEELDASGNGTGERAFHVSECTMFDVPTSAGE